jgi:hypothetical protein
MSTNETGGAVDVLEALAASWNEKNIGKAEYDRRSVVYAAVAELIAENARLRRRSMLASGFGALLSEILGCGALRKHDDLRERVTRAANDHEADLRAVLARIGGAK